MSEKILVTGATGRVGSELVWRLQEKNKNVIAGVRTEEHAEWARNAGMNPIIFDYEDPRTMRYAFKKIDKIFLITPLTPKAPRMILASVEEAIRNDVKHLVRLSSIEAESFPASLAGRWHTDEEKALESSDIPWTILRPNAYMQNFISYSADDINRNNSFSLPVADGAVSYIDTRDVASVAAEILTNPGHEYNKYTLTGGEALSGYRISTILSHVLQKPIYYREISDDEARDIMEKAGLPRWLIDTLMEIYILQRNNHFNMVNDNVSRITGKSPITFEQFVRDYNEQFIKQPERVPVLF